MKTKNFLLTGALLIMALFSVNGVMAQVQDYTTNATTTSDVKVSLIFNPIQSIQVNTAQENIDFEYSTPDHYTNGLQENVVQTKKDHLTVYHSGPFDVKITSTNFSNGDDTFYGDHVKVSAILGSSSSSYQGALTPAGPVNLNEYANAAQFIASNSGAMGLTFDVIYDHSDAELDQYLNKNLSSIEATYQAVVTYTIVSQ